MAAKTCAGIKSVVPKASSTTAASFPAIISARDTSASRSFQACPRGWDDGDFGFAALRAAFLPGAGSDAGGRGGAGFCPRVGMAGALCDVIDGVVIGDSITGDVGFRDGDVFVAVGDGDLFGDGDGITRFVGGGVAGVDGEGIGAVGIVVGPVLDGAVSPVAGL